MNTFIALFEDETGAEMTVEIDVPDLVENVSEYIRDEYPEMQLIYVKPAGF